MKNRLKNIYFWLGMVAVLFAAGGVDFNTLTSWKLLLESLIGILGNPVAVMSVILSFIGIFIDPTTPGITDKQ